MAMEKLADTIQALRVVRTQCEEKKRRERLQVSKKSTYGAGPSSPAHRKNELKKQNSIHSPKKSVQVSTADFSRGSTADFGRGSTANFGRGSTVPANFEEGGSKKAGNMKSFGSKSATLPQRTSTLS